MKRFPFLVLLAALLAGCHSQSASEATADRAASLQLQQYLAERYGNLQNKPAWFDSIKIVVIIHGAAVATTALGRGDHAAAVGVCNALSSFVFAPGAHGPAQAVQVNDNDFHTLVERKGASDSCR